MTERFWAKVDKHGPAPSHVPLLGECWVWTGHKTSSGYGGYWDGRMSTAHRVSWALSFGPIPDGLWVLHHCDNRPCVRPDHLFLGTAADNAADREAKGRSREPSRRLVGEDHVRARLTIASIREATHLRAVGSSWADLGRRYGVSPSTVFRAVEGQSWRVALAKASA